MPKKTYRPEEIIAKLREAEALVGEGSPWLLRTTAPDESSNTPPCNPPATAHSVT